MINQSTLRAGRGAISKSKRLGRGNGSGKGSKSGKGTNGQNSRSGSHFRLGEQTTYLDQMPKQRGFTAFKPTRYSVVNISVLDRLASEGVKKIDSALLVEKGIVRSAPVKLLANGQMTQAVDVTVEHASAQAIAAIENAGGHVTVTQKGE